MKFNNRVFGLVGISAKMSNWNADFTGRPKSTSNNQIYGSDKAFKYPIKYLWDVEGESVLYIKSFKEDKKDLRPRSLKERYELIFHTTLDKKKTKGTEVLKNLFSAIDVKNFGATFAEENQNISITGAVQIGQGMNIYEKTSVEIQDILSPFRNAKSEDAGAASLGTKIVVDEAHYVYPFSINPYAYDDYVSTIDDFEGYTIEAYEKYKDGCLRATTAFGTNSKFGCDNEYGLFIKLKENSKMALPNLAQFVSMKKEDEKTIIDFTKLNSLLAGKVLEEVENIELYYNPYEISIEGIDKEKVSLLNIFTREVI
ncbi:MAG: type I CRISPR-associated protein Cas7 [Anaeromicrobium sp.]|jgi:CRISPR-associated protein Csh2|uniref:type I CRISPR-associated protein Cas7 n=1 Tax=Anaeromicrobium sp. TaxID=1929132 RepID=UPI0025D9D549|nr:type I CRISPR-associated protein Cas7 [Anaeromicrobium sp.]MCT4594811.1 type I CRISPR-associated protein Cas7 [Anaeromicrobium sp.]